MNQLLYTLSLSTLTLTCAFLFFAYRHEWIIIASSQLHFNIQQFKQQTITKKECPLCFWKQNKWHVEEVEILCSQKIEKQLTRIINKWLIVLDEERITHTKITVQTILLSPSSYTAYISFDHTLFNSESAIFEKYMIVESLLKTIRENDIDIQNIFLLVHHRLLDDVHLDFSHPWPITGFLCSSF